MLARELAARANKLEAEQKSRSERERQRLEKERLLQERARQREREREEEQQRKKLEQLEQEERERERVFRETEHNHGVYLRVELAAVPADEVALQAKGIKRSKDKVLLPPSVGASLMAQDAPKNGAQLFELALPGDPAARTHCGVLEYTAPEGTVVLPRKVARSLWGRLDAEVRGTVIVTYRRLEKADYVRLQPMVHDFHERVGDGMREVLEATLAGHATLTEGDWLVVDYGDQEYTLRVQELRPAPGVSVIDTECVADVVPSLESEEYLRRWAEEQRRQAERLEALAAERRAQEEAERLRRQQEEAEAAAQAAADADRRERARMLKAASLPAEPPHGTPEPHAQCLFRLPGGGRVSRRVLLQQPLQMLFDFVDSQPQPAEGQAAPPGGVYEPGSYQLVTRFPRRVVGPADALRGLTLGDFGVAAGAQEAFFVEALEEAAVQQDDGAPMEH